MTQNLFTIPNLGLNSYKDKAIPVFDPFLMGENFQKFVKSLDYVVNIYEYVHAIFTLDNPKESFFVLLLISNIIMYFE